MFAGQVVMALETVGEEPEGEAPVPVSHAKRTVEGAATVPVSQAKKQAKARETQGSTA